jgi:hypothetical protein
LPADDFARHGEALLRAAPVEVLRLTTTDRDLVRWTVDIGRGHYRYDSRQGHWFEIGASTVRGTFPGGVRRAGPLPRLFIGNLTVEVTDAEFARRGRDVTGFGDEFRRMAVESRVTLTLGRRLPPEPPVNLPLDLLRQSPVPLH